MNQISLSPARSLETLNRSFLLSSHSQPSLTLNGEKTDNATASIPPSMVSRSFPGVFAASSMVLVGTEDPSRAAAVGARLGNFSYLLSMDTMYERRSARSAVAL